MSLSTLFRLRNLRYRYFSSPSGTPISFTLSFQPEPEPDISDSETQDPIQNDNLRSRLFRLRFPKRSATAVLDKWALEGKKAIASELRHIAKDLKKEKRYKHALEISEWMKTHRENELNETDYATRIDLITRVFGVNAAGEFFDGLPSAAKTSEVYASLLHAYAKSKLIDKAEHLFERMKELNLSSSPLAYNEMMTLYISVGQLEKVPLAVEELKRNNISPDLFTYNLWISSTAASFDVEGVKNILYEMLHDSNCNEGWKMYIKLANIYLDIGSFVKSTDSLVEGDGKISQREWIAYDFLIILYSGLGNWEGITQIWKSLKLTSQKMTSRSYMCVISSYILLGRVKEAEETIDEWMQSKLVEFDSLMCGRLLNSFVNAGLNEEAETFKELMLRRNFEI